MLRIVIISALTFIGMAILGRIFKVGLFALSVKRERARDMRETEKVRRERFLFDPASFPPTTKKEVFETAQYVDNQTKYASLCVTQIEENLQKYAKDGDLAIRVAPMIQTFRRHEEVVDRAIFQAKRYCSQSGVNIPRSIAHSNFPELTVRLRAALRSSGVKTNF